MNDNTETNNTGIPLPIHIDANDLRFRGGLPSVINSSPINYPGKFISVETDDGMPPRVVRVLSSKVIGGGVEETTWKYEDTGEIETRTVWFDLK